MSFCVSHSEREKQESVGSHFLLLCWASFWYRSLHPGHLQDLRKRMAHLGSFEIHKIWHPHYLVPNMPETLTGASHLIWKVKPSKILSMWFPSDLELSGNSDYPYSDDTGGALCPVFFSSSHLFSILGRVAGRGAACMSHHATVVVIVLSVGPHPCPVQSKRGWPRGLHPDNCPCFTYVSLSISRLHTMRDTTAETRALFPGATATAAATATPTV